MRNQPPFRADHVGSLLRPPDLLRARTDHAAGRLDDDGRRIDEAARHVPLDQLCLSPQCGFSSTVEGNELTVDDQIAKLRLVAADVWG